MELQAGTKYKGYFWVNEYGEIQVQPEQTGANAGRMKIIKEGTGWTVNNTQKKVIVHISFDKQENKLENIQVFMKKVDEVINVLKEYEI